MTSEVIDTLHRRCLAECMRQGSAKNVIRFDGTLRAVMWMDAFLSIALTLVCMIASPVVATLGLPREVVVVLGVALIGCAVLLAAFGAITAVLIMLRMRAGQCLLPAGLRLPLPAGMRPL